MNVNVMIGAKLSAQYSVWGTHRCIVNVIIYLCRPILSSACRGSATVSLTKN